MFSKELSLLARRKTLNSGIFLCLGNLPACVFILLNATPEPQMAAGVQQVWVSLLFNTNLELAEVDRNLPTSSTSA